MTLEKLAARLALPAAELEARLEPMCDRGVVLDLVNPRDGKRSYLLAPPVVGFFEYSLMRANDSIPKKRMAEALSAYTHGDPAFAREAFGKDTVIGRALAHETALADDLPDVLGWERASEVVGSARTWAVSLCFCRHKAEHLGQACDAPMDNCLSLNGGADFVVRRGFGRAIEKTEALELLARAREHGLVHVADNVKNRPTFVCSCCGCCCEQLQAISHWGLPAVNPSGFVPRRDAARCAGCSRCARACPIGAIAHGAGPPAGQPQGGARARASTRSAASGAACAPGPATRTRSRWRAAATRARCRRPRWSGSSARRSSGTGSPSCSSTRGPASASKFLHHAVDAIMKLPPGAGAPRLRAGPVALREGRALAVREALARSSAVEARPGARSRAHGRAARTARIRCTPRRRRPAPRRRDRRWQDTRATGTRRSGCSARRRSRAGARRARRASTARGGRAPRRPPLPPRAAAASVAGGTGALEAGRCAARRARAPRPRAGSWARRGPRGRAPARRPRRSIARAAPARTRAAPVIAAQRPGARRATRVRVAPGAAPDLEPGSPQRPVQPELRAARAGRVRARGTREEGGERPGGG